MNDPTFFAPFASHLVAERYRIGNMTTSAVHYSYACGACVAALRRTYTLGRFGMRRFMCPLPYVNPSHGGPEYCEHHT